MRIGTTSILSLAAFLVASTWPRPGFAARQITTTNFDVPGADTPGSVGTLAVSINRSGAVYGGYYDAAGVEHGFVRSRGGAITTFDPVGSVFTAWTTLGINREGTITGGFYDLDSVLHGFVRDRQGTISNFDAPLAGTVANAGSLENSINDAGTITGSAIDAIRIHP